MIRIICDTMIWYELSKNRLNIPDPEKYTLVCTYLSLTELSFTPNNFKILGEVQDAIKTILSIEPELVMYNPFDYARRLIDSDFRHDYKVEKDLVFGFLRILLNHPSEGLINNEFKDQLTDLTSKRKKNSADWADFLNKLHEPSKKISGILKRYHDEKDDKIHFRNSFILQLNQFNDNSYSEEIINWNEFELYEEVNERHFRNLSLSKRKVQKNDENDLKNMIYVQPEDKYWTLEKRWLSIIREIKFDKYLYNPSTN